MRCTMCGYEFTEEQMTCHASCPLGAGCMVVCCPRCGYSTVNAERSLSKKWLGRLLGRKERSWRPGVPGAIRLLDLQPGQEGEVVSLGEDEPARLLQLSQYGLTPGTPVRLTQRRPVPVVQVGQTDLALDVHVAAGIYVEIQKPTSSQLP